MRARKMRTVATVVALLAVTGCIDFGPKIGGGGCTTTCEDHPMVTPYGPNMLRGDTVRFTACNDFRKCSTAGDTGNVVSKWTIPDSNLVMLTNGTSATLVPASTHVLVRGVAAGFVKLSATFSTGGGSNSGGQVIRVADSSEVKSILLSMYGYSDTVRVNAVRMIGVQLRDVGGYAFLAAPTSISASDTTILRVTSGNTGLAGTLELKVVALKAGKASITVTFLGITATRQLTVVP